MNNLYLGQLFLVLILFSSTTQAIFQTDLIRDENLKWVKACSGRVPETKTQLINYRFTQLCKKPNLYYSAKSNFRIKNVNHQISLNYKIRLKILPALTSIQEAQAMLQLARSCVSLNQSVWSRYGVSVNLSFDSDREPQTTDPSLPIRTINFYNYVGRGNAENFYKINDVDFCKVVSHEVGHHLGLPDEYEDVSCPDRSFVSQEVNPYSLMAYIYYPWQQLDFFPRHLRTVLSSFCGEARPSREELPQGDWIDLGPPE